MSLCGLRSRTFWSVHFWTSCHCGKWPQTFGGPHEESPPCHPQAPAGNADEDGSLWCWPQVSTWTSDTLSRAHPELAGDTEPSPFHCVNAFTLMPVTDRRLEELREATTADDTMHELISVIRDGWPDRKDDLPELVKPFFDVRDTLTEQDGIILKGERLVIPPSMRADVKQRLHAAHLGHESMLRRARELIYWPKMNHEIKQLADSCDICQAHSPRQSKEPLIPHQRGDTPWQKIGIDLFSIDQRDYMVTVDYLSNFWEVDYLSSTTTSAILTKLKAHLARYGIPQVIVSDNAQFT